MKPLEMCFACHQSATNSNSLHFFFAALGFGALTVALSFLATQLGAILQVIEWFLFS